MGGEGRDFLQDRPSTKRFWRYGIWVSTKKLSWWSCSSKSAYFRLRLIPMCAYIETIRYLASADDQWQFVVSGTADEYLLPEELVANALTFTELVATGRIGHSFSTLQRKSLDELRSALLTVELVVSDDISNEDLITKDSDWAILRESAQQFVHTIDIAVTKRAT